MATDAAVDVAAEPALAPLTAMRRLEFAEHLRLPYVVSQLPAHVPQEDSAWLQRVDTAHGASMLWPMEAQLPLRPVMARLRLIDQPAIALCARILDDRGVQARLGEGAGDWSRVAALTGVDGQPVGSLWTDRDGNLLLPFDPDEVLLNYWSERYVDELESNGRGWGARAALRTYYRVRVVLPRAVQIWMRRRYARVQARTPFPRWPLETSLHDYIDLLLGLLADLAGAELPYIAPWPDGHSWALVLTHDVETTVGLGALDPLLDIERSHGMRSSWNFVPRRYAVPDALVRELQADGFEVGVHGLHHDGRDLSSLSGLRSRLPAIHAVAQRWRAVGFRSPASHRRWEWMALLPFDYDSSYPDTDPFEPQRGGCCSWWPFFNGQLVELPLTMPHDHTLFVILGHRDESTWVDKAQVLRERGGMALIVTHPDYLLEGPGLAAYDRSWRVTLRTTRRGSRSRAGERVVAAARSVMDRAVRQRLGGDRAGGGPSPDRVRSRWAREVSVTPTRSPTPSGASRDLEVAVIGAGPHGLAAAVRAAPRWGGAHVFGEPMSFWRSMPDGMRLRSNLRARNMIELGARSPWPLQGGDRPHAGGPDRPGDFVAYGSWVQARAIPDVDRRFVPSVRRDGGGWRLQCDDGETLTAAAGRGRSGHRSVRAQARRLEHHLGGRASHALGCPSRPGAPAWPPRAGRRRRPERARARGAARRNGRGRRRSARPRARASCGCAGTPSSRRWAVSADRLRAHRRGPAVVQRARAGRACSPAYPGAPRTASPPLIRPACSHFVRVRLGEVTIRTRRAGGRCRSARRVTASARTRSDRRQRAHVDHLMFGHGYGWTSLATRSSPTSSWVRSGDGGGYPGARGGASRPRFPVST